MLHRLPWNDYFAFDGHVSTFQCIKSIIIMAL